MDLIQSRTQTGTETCPLRGAIDAGLKRLGDKPAYYMLNGRAEPEQSLTGNELRARAISLARHVQQRPLQPRRIAIVTQAGQEFLVALLACFYGGFECVAPPFPTPGPSRKRFDKIVEHCRPDFALTTQADVANLSAKFGEVGLDDIIVEAVRMDAHGVDEPDEALQALSEGECGILQHTSGTSGVPRAVVVRGHNIVANARLVQQSWGFSPNDTMLTWLPHHHDMGLFGCLITPLIVGFPINQMAPFTFLKRPARWMQAVSKSRATITGGPAFALQLAIDAGGALEDLDLSSLNSVFCGSEPIPPALLQNFADHFAPAGLRPSAPFACFGLAETTLYVAGRPATSLTPACELFDDGEHEIRIVDPTSHELCPSGKEGEIWLSGPSVSSGYLDSPEENAMTFTSDLVGQAEPDRMWLRTGDLGHIEENALFISGRIKDMIISNGANIPASEMEWTATASAPAFAGMAAAAFAYGELSEGSVALVIEVERSVGKEMDHDAATAKIKAAVRGAHGVDLADVLIVKRGKLPRTTSGKIQRSVVREMYLGSEFTPTQPQVQATL